MKSLNDGVGCNFDDNRDNLRPNQCPSVAQGDTTSTIIINLNPTININYRTTIVAIILTTIETILRPNQLPGTLKGDIKRQLRSIKHQL